MKAQANRLIERAKLAALEVLRYNAHGSYQGLPRAAAWGYPEPYTRDIMLSAPGFLVTEDPVLLDAMRRTLLALAQNQSPRGHIPSLAHDPENRGASDTTPLFLFGLELYRRVAKQPEFLVSAAQNALLWMEYQSPDDRVLVAQLPTSDWRDEQWVLGYGLYVNTLLYAALKLLRITDRAAQAHRLLNRADVHAPALDPHQHEGLSIPGRPYYALWSYKLYNEERCDVLGNSLAVLTGVAAPKRAREIVGWIEAQCETLREAGQLSIALPPCLIPFIERSDPDYRPRYDEYNRPGHYHNGGVWPFVCGFYIAACVTVGEFELAERKLSALVELVRVRRDPTLTFGFNEWIHPATGEPRGHDWQTWSAALFLYAAACVEQRRPVFFDEVAEDPRNA